MLIIVPINVKEVCVYYAFYPTLTLLSPPLLIYHQWILCNLLTSPPFILMYKMSCKTAILWSIFSICWDVASQELWAFWSYKLIKFSIGLDISYTNNWHNVKDWKKYKNIHTQLSIVVDSKPWDIFLFLFYQMFVEQKQRAGIALDDWHIISEQNGHPPSFTKLTVWQMEADK